MNCNARGSRIDVVSKVRTVELRTHDFKNKINDDNILYLNPNKKETTQWFQTVGESIPLGGTKFGLIHSISDFITKNNPQNVEGQNFDEAFAIDVDEEVETTNAAPVELNGVRGNMGVVVNRHGNHLYAHRILLPDGTEFRFSDIKEDVTQELSRGVTVSSSLADTTSVTSTNSIRTSAEKYNLQNAEGQNFDEAFAIDVDEEVVKK